MALTPSLLGYASAVPWHLGCTASLSALNLLKSSLAHQTLPFTNVSTSTQPAHKHPHPACACQSSNFARSPNGKPGTLPLAAAFTHIVGSQGFSRQNSGQSWKFSSNTIPAAHGFRSFSASAMPHEDDSTKDAAPVLPGGKQGQASPQSTAQKRVQHALHILQHGNVLTLRNNLIMKAETNFHMTYDELLQMAKQSGAAHTQAEAEELAEALSRSGVVMRYQNIIYLRPQEVAEMVIKALPDSHLEAKEKVREIDAELEAMRDVIEGLDRSASRWARVWLWGGCGLLALQLASFIRLTWWELSWDVMEPFAYVIGLTNTLIGYIYFMVFRNDFDYKPFEDYWKNRTKTQNAIEQKLDLQRYEELLKLRTRYVQHMEAISTDMKNQAQVASAS